MGNTTSNNSARLYEILSKEISELIYKYKFWTDDQICDKLTLTYYDKLIQFQKSDLLDASVAIGIKNSRTDNVDKDELCKNIIKHYKDRITLLKEISDAVDKGHRRVNMAKHGPVCKNVDTFAEDFFTCEKYNGLWLNSEQYNRIINKLKKMDVFRDWMKNIHKLEYQWVSCMKHFLKIVRTIKEDVDNSLDDKTFNGLRENTKATIKKMEYISDIYYLLIINYG